jgi:FMN phosphatase YigB (HAD superfamily)
MTPKAVLFDFSATLFDDTAVLRPWRLARCAATRGRTLGIAEAGNLCRSMMSAVDSPAGRAAREGADRSSALHRRIWVDLAARAQGADRVLAEALYECATTPEFWPPFPDTAQVLTSMFRHGVPVGVVSNIAWDIRRTFAHAGLDGFVRTFVLSCEHGMVKPDAGLFTVACRELGVAERETLMVGDDPLCDGGAVAVGMPVLLLPARRGQGERGLAQALRLLRISEAVAAQPEEASG